MKGIHESRRQKTELAPFASTKESDERLRETLQMPPPYKRPVGRSRPARVKSTDGK
jgi:hypothetical protein